MAEKKGRGKAEADVVRGYELEVALRPCPVVLDDVCWWWCRHALNYSDFLEGDAHNLE